MRIGIDIRPLQTASQYRGIGRVLFNILYYGKDKLNKHSLDFYAESNLKLPEIIKSFNNAEVIWINSGFRKKRFIRAIISEYKTAKPRKDTDVFLQVEASLGMPTNVKNVVFFHDAIPIIFRKEELKSQNIGLLSFKRQAASNLYWKKYIKTLDCYKRASEIITISNHSQKDLNKFVLKGVKVKSKVVHLSATPLTTKETRPSFIPKEKYLLYVGGIDYRKNVVGVLRDFAEVRKSEPNIKFIFVGKEFSKTSELDDFGWSQTIAKFKLKDGIIIPGFVPDEELAYLYSHALAFVFPSKYEGFGLPVLEAMQSGCPVIAYKNSSIPEIAGDSAILVNDNKSMAPAILRILKEDDLRNDLIKKGKIQVSKFSWKKTAAETIRTLEEVGS